MGLKYERTVSFGIPCRRISVFSRLKKLFLNHNEFKFIETKRSAKVRIEGSRGRTYDILCTVGVLLDTETGTCDRVVGNKILFRTTVIFDSSRQRNPAAIVVLEN